MRPEKLIGLKYRLGSNPEEHGTADCLSLARAVLAHQGIDAPKPQRDWYRRLKKGDMTVFPEELERWGIQITEPTMGSVALCKAGNGYGLAVYWSGGWIAFNESEVAWNPLGALQVVGLYFPRKLNSAMQLV